MKLTDEQVLAAKQCSTFIGMISFRLYRVGMHAFQDVTAKKVSTNVNFSLTRKLLCRPLCV